MPADRFLIVNADDFGQSPGVNRGVIQAHEHGIVTSASLMVRWPAAIGAAEYGRDHPDLSLGLHVDLGEWAYRAGDWVLLYSVAPLEDARSLAAEIDGQIAAFQRLTGRDPTHLDSHQHVHHQEPIRSILVERAHKLEVPLRGCSPIVRYSGRFYGQTAKGVPYPEGIGVAGLIEILSTLPAGVTELGCHPGYGEDLETMYRAERAAEVRILCDPRVRAALRANAVELCSFADLSRLTSGTPGGFSD